MAKHMRRIRLSTNGGSHTPEEWDAVCKFYGNKCLACGKSNKKLKLTKDHVTPLSCGGKNDISNIQPLCEICNQKKSDSIIDYRIINFYHQ